MTLSVDPGRYSVYRFPAGAGSPDASETCETCEPGRLFARLSASRFASVTRTPTELSVVAETGSLSAAREESGWKLMRVEGTLDFSLTGVLASICAPLASAGFKVVAGEAVAG